MKKMLLKVVIPFYKENIATWEHAALDNNLRMLSAYPICFLYPRGLNMEKYAQAHPQAEIAWLENSGHMGFLEEPDASAEIIRSFINRHGGVETVR